MTIMEQKKLLRKQMLSKRAKLDVHKKIKYDEWICQSVWEIIDKHCYTIVHCFLPMATEINIYPLIEKMVNNKILVVSPKTHPNRRLQNLILKSLNELEKGPFGTHHPANSQEFLEQYDLIIVPGLAFDDTNNRLGYGGGYYDNFLLRHSNAYKLGIAYSFQQVEKIPIESHDVKLDHVLFA